MIPMILIVARMESGDALSVRAGALDSAIDDESGIETYMAAFRQMTE